VRNWMMIAAWWLGFEKDDQSTQVCSFRRVGHAFDTGPSVIAARQLASETAAENRLLADFFALRGRWCGLDLPKLGAELAKSLPELVSRYSQTPVAALATLVADQLAMEVLWDGDVTWSGDMARAVRFRNENERAINTTLAKHPMVASYLRKAKGAGSSLVNKSFSSELKRLDGTTLRLPDDFAGKVIVLRFFTVGTAPGIPGYERLGSQSLAPGLTPEQTKDVVFVAVSLDSSREELEKFLGKEKPNWTVAWSGKGWEDPLVKQLDIDWLPTTWVIDRLGRVRSDDRETRPLAEIIKGILDPASARNR